MRRRTLFALSSLSLAAQESPIGTRLARVRQLLVSEMAKRKIPGLAIAVADRERILWDDALGYADLENGTPVKETSRFRLASISKPLTAVAVLQLVEQGRIGLDADIREYVKMFPHKASVRQLLGHLGGVRHYRGREVESTRHYSDAIAPLEIFLRDPLAHTPGTAYHYTTYGYNLLGAAVQLVSGVPYVDYVRQNILAPAAIKGIVPDDHFAIVEGRVRGYARRSDGTVVNAVLADTSNKIPGGGWLGTAGGVTKFALALRQGRFVSKETVAWMMRSQKEASGRETGYGLGLQLFRHLDQRVPVEQRLAGHTGSQPGTNTVFATTLDGAWTVTILTNLEGAAPVTLAEAVVAGLLE